MRLVLLLSALGTGFQALPAVAAGQFASAPSQSVCDPIELMPWQAGLVEAQIIASEMLVADDRLYPDPAIVERIADDLAAIRAAEPFLGFIVHQPIRPPGRIRLFVDPAVWPSKDAQCLLELYPGQLFEYTDPYRKEIDYGGPISYERIRAEWLLADGVYAAFLFPLEDGPKFTLQGIGPTGTSTWKIDRRFGEFCFEKCECRWVYVFRVTASGQATRREFDWSGEFPWCAP